MTYHSLFVRVRDSSRFQITHCCECLVDLRLHLAEEIVRKFHPADIDRKIKLVVAQKELLESLPKRRRSHRRRCSVVSDECAVVGLVTDHRSTLILAPVTCHLSLLDGDFVAAGSFLTGTSSFGATSYSGFDTPISHLSNQPTMFCKRSTRCHG